MFLVLGPARPSEGESSSGCDIRDALRRYGSDVGVWGDSYFPGVVCCRLNAGKTLGFDEAGVLGRLEPDAPLIGDGGKPWMSKRVSETDRLPW